MDSGERVQLGRGLLSRCRALMRWLGLLYRQAVLYSWHSHALSFTLLFHHQGHRELPTFVLYNSQNCASVYAEGP